MISRDVCGNRTNDHVNSSRRRGRKARRVSLKAKLSRMAGDDPRYDPWRGRKVGESVWLGGCRRFLAAKQVGTGVGIGWSCLYLEQIRCYRVRSFVFEDVFGEGSLRAADSLKLSTFSIL